MRPVKILRDFVPNHLVPLLPGNSGTVNIKKRKYELHDAFNFEIFKPSRNLKFLFRSLKFVKRNF